MHKVKKIFSRWYLRYILLLYDSFVNFTRHISVTCASLIRNTTKSKILRRRLALGHADLDLPADLKDLPDPDPSHRADLDPSHRADLDPSHRADLDLSHLADLGLSHRADLKVLPDLLNLSEIPMREFGLSYW